MFVCAWAGERVSRVGERGKGGYECKCVETGTHIHVLGAQVGGQVGVSADANVRVHVGMFVRSVCVRQRLCS